MKKVLFVFLALALVGCVTAASAQQPANPPQGPPPGMQMGGMMRGAMMTCPAMAVAPPQAMMISRSAETLGLTDDQKTKLQAVLTKSETALKDLRPKLDAASKAVRDAVLAASYDSTKVSQLLGEAQKAEMNIAVSEIGTWVEIRGILSAEQLQKLSEAMAARMGGGTGGGYFGGANRGNNSGGNRGQGNRGPGNRGQQPGVPPPPATDSDQ